MGCTTYENFFTHEEMLNMERKIEATEMLCSKSKKIVKFTFLDVYLPETA